MYSEEGELVLACRREIKFSLSLPPSLAPSLPPSLSLCLSPQYFERFMPFMESFASLVKIKADGTLFVTKLIMICIAFHAIREFADFVA